MQNVESGYQQEELKALKGGPLTGSVRGIERIYICLSKKIHLRENQEHLEMYALRTLKYIH